MTTAPCTVSRPDGTTYRARLAPTAVLLNEPETKTVLVLRTHDLDQARRLAEQLINRDRLEGGRQIWVRKNQDRRWETVEANKNGALPAVAIGVSGR